jgi:hypothetical protein
MVNHVPTSEVYAMKSIKKEIVLKANNVEGTKGKLLNIIIIHENSGKRYPSKVGSSIHYEVVIFILRQ